MRKILLGVLMALATTASAQQLDLSSLDRLADKAESKTEITLDEATLNSTTALLSEKKGTEAVARKAVEGLKGLFLRSYEFEKPGSFKLEDLKPLMDQLKAPNWTPILRAKEQDEQTEIWAHRTNGVIDGMVLIAAEEDEVTVINAIGLTRIEDLSKLRDFGMPGIGFGGRD